MSFFKDFKEDFSQAVNELIPGEDLEKDEKEQSDLVVNTLEDEMDVKSELEKLEGLFEKVKESAEDELDEDEMEPEEVVAEEVVIQEPKIEKTIQEPPKAPAGVRSAIEEMQRKNTPEVQAPVKEENLMSTEEITTSVLDQTSNQPPVLSKEVTEEVAIITEGTTLTGNLESTGSIEIRGKVNGNIQCNGKMTITGVVKGNSTSAELFADSAKIEGEINTEGTVKIGLGSVVVGNITATSAVIAGAIKGDIDVQGPVVVDTSAVVMGNIKSRSVQINNGAVIEGFCSQSYAEVDVASLFGESKEAE